MIYSDDEYTKVSGTFSAIMAELTHLIYAFAEKLDMDHAIILNMIDEALSEGIIGGEKDD